MDISEINISETKAKEIALDYVRKHSNHTCEIIAVVKIVAKSKPHWQEKTGWEVDLGCHCFELMKVIIDAQTRNVADVQQNE